MKAPRYYAGREIDYYLLWVISALAVITLVSVLLGGCASPGPRDYDCYKVVGPMKDVATVTPKQDIENLLLEASKYSNVFEDEPIAFMCIDVTASKDLRSYPRGK